MPTIKKSELIKIRASFYMCRFPALSAKAIETRRRIREDNEFREKFFAHNRRIAKTKRYSVESMDYMRNGLDRTHSDEVRAKISASLSKTRVRDMHRRGMNRTEIHNRPNDYAGVVSMSEFNSL